MRLSPNGKPVVVQTGASVIVEDGEGRILMQRRSDDGTWSYPGGRVEIDEAVQDAARREVREECGIEVGELELLGIFSGPELRHIYPNGDEVSCIDIVYIARGYQGALRSLDGEAAAIGFYPTDHLPAPLSAMNTPQIKAYLQARAKSEKSH